MKERYIEELYKSIKSELKKSDLEDIHEIAYNYTSREFIKIDKRFLDYYLTNIVKALKAYSNENITSINYKIQQSIHVENKEKFTGVNLDLSSSEQASISDVKIIKLSEIFDFRELEKNISELQKDIRRDMERGRNNGLGI